MKKSIKYFFISLGKCLSYVYPTFAAVYISGIKSLVYTGWLSRSLNKIGKKSSICYSGTIWGGEYITIGNSVYIGKNAVITAWDKYEDQVFTPEIIIGDKTAIGEYCHISAISKIIIGENVLTGRWLTIVDNGHGRTESNDLSLPPMRRPLCSNGIIEIKDNVWIGDKVTILAGVTIGINAIIGANSVVVKD